jgi:hypothetical protein
LRPVVAWGGSAHAGTLRPLYRRRPPRLQGGGNEGTSSHDSGRAARRQRGRTGYVRVRARHAARGLPWRSGRVGPQDAQPRGAEPWEGARSASGRRARERRRRGGVTACARVHRRAGARVASRARARCVRFNVSVCLGLTAFFSKILNRSVQSGE